MARQSTPQCCYLWAMLISLGNADIFGWFDFPSAGVPGRWHRTHSRGAQQTASPHTRCAAVICAASPRAAGCCPHRPSCAHAGSRDT
eukprot:2982780-Prymnesium_polylepis.1